jgi:hypothetical protein
LSLSEGRNGIPLKKTDIMKNTTTAIVMHGQEHAPARRHADQSQAIAMHVQGHVRVRVHHHGGLIQGIAMS